MAHELLRVALDQFVEVPKIIDLHQIRVVASGVEFWISFQEQVRDVVPMHEAVEGGRAETLLHTEVVAQRTGGLGEVVDEPRVLAGETVRMMIDDDPAGLVETFLKAEIADPGALLAQFACLPRLIMIRLQLHVLTEEMPGQPL